ncbi:MAG: hypothetical protein NTV43_17655 [Methylococcales bacterium]|nr:hypothetical protein [Methylococcales bacterium]
MPYMRTIRTKKGIDYIRWQKDGAGDYYVATYLLFSRVIKCLIVNNESDCKKVQEEADSSGQDTREWYLKESDLDTATEPTSLTLYSDNYSVCITSNRNVKVRSWWSDFKGDLLNITPVQYDKVSGNPWGRYDNSPRLRRTVVFRTESKLNQAQTVLNESNNKKRNHCETQLSTTAPAGQVKTGIYPFFETFADPSNIISLVKPINTKALKVHNDLFDDNYIQNSEKRTLTATVTKNQVLAWCGQERFPSQIKLMKNKSGKDVAKSLDLDVTNIEYEWLHLVAHSLGPSQDYKTPQNIKNLVFGTAAANSQMLIFEENLRHYANNRTIYLNVTVSCMQLQPGKYASWLATEIEYSYQDTDSSSPDSIPPNTVKFDPFQAVPPSFAEKLVFEELAKPPAKKIPKKLLFAALIVPTKPKLDQLSNGEIQIHGLDFDQVTPRAVSIKATDRHDGLLLASGSEHTVTTTTPPDGLPFAAMTTALGKSEVPVKGALLNDGRRFATLELEPKNFSFSQLFKDFECEGVDLFIFDDVNIHLQHQPDTAGSENIVSFSGTLRMDSGPLAPLRDLLKLDKGVFLSGEIGIGEQGLAGKIEPDYLTLTSAASFHVPLAEGLTLTKAGLQITIGRRIDYLTMSLGWFCRATLTGSLEISGLGSKNPILLNCLLAYNNGVLHASAVCEEVEGLFGLDQLKLDYLEAQLDLGTQNDVELSASFSTASRSFGLGGKLASKFVGLYAEAEDFTLDDLNDIFVSITGEQLALPEFDVTFKDVLLGLATADGSVASVALTKGLTLIASVNIHGHDCEVIALISPDGVAFTGSLGKLDIGPVQIETAKLHFQIYKASSGKPVEFAIIGTAKIEGLEVECKAGYEKLGGSWTCVLYAGLHAASFGLSTIFPEAKGSFVDSLRFRKLAFVYASADCSTLDADYAFPVRKGLQLMAVLEEIQELSNLTGSTQSGLMFSAHFGGTGTDIAIALENTKLKLGKSVSCDPFRIMIVIQPQPALDLVFGLDVSLPKQSKPLHFDLKLEVGVAEARGSATLKNWWEEPFGIEHLKIGPALALQLGINYAQFVSTGLPDEFGFAGGLKLGNVEAQMALSISEDPSHEILLGSLSQLTPQDLVEFAKTITGLHLEPGDVPDFFEIHDLQLYCAPTGCSIGTIIFEPGFSFGGKLILFGKTASIYTRFSSQGMVAKGHIDTLELGPLKIRGELGKNADLDLELTADKQAVLIDGAFDFLGLEAGLLVDISKHGVKFHFEESFFGQIKYVVHGESQGTLTQISSLDFLLSSQFDNTLTAYLKNTVADKIHAAINVVEGDINDAQLKVDAAENIYKKQYDKAMQTLNDAQAKADENLRLCSRRVAEETNKYTDALEAANQKLSQAKAAYDKALQDAQNAVGKMQGDFDTAMRKAEAALNQAQADYDKAMRSAQQAVDDAQRKYDNAMGSAASDVRNAREKVGSLQHDIDGDKSELDHLEWYEGFRAAVLLADICGLEISMRGAQGILWGAEKLLDIVRIGGDFTVFQRAKDTLELVRSGGKYLALKGAKNAVEATKVGIEYGVLEAAKQTLNGIQQSTEYTLWQSAQQTLTTLETTGRDGLTQAEADLEKIGQSATYLALEAAKQGLEAVKQGTAAAAFESAKVTLEALKHGVEDMLALGEYVARHAGDVVDVKKVSLSSRLIAIESGDFFKAQVAIAVLGNDYDWRLDFKVRDAGGFVESLFKLALDKAKTLAKG